MTFSGRVAWGHGLTVFFVGLAVKIALLFATTPSDFFAWKNATPLAPVLLCGADALAAALYGFLCWALLRFAARSDRARRVCAHGLRVFSLLLSVWLVANYYVFHFLGAPFTPGMSEMAGDLGDLFSSVQDLLEPSVFVAIGAAVAAGLILPSLLGQWMDRVIEHSRLWTLAATVVALVWFGSSEVLAHTRRTEFLETNALLALLFPKPTIELARARPNTKGRGPVRMDMRSVAAAAGMGNPRLYETADLSEMAGTARGAHVLLVVLESTGAQYLGLYGADGPDTAPRMTRLAEHGLVFENFSSLSPASMKALFTLFCSTYPYPAAKAETYVNPRMPCHSLGEILTRSGYEAALFHSGKFSYTHKDKFFSQRGFDPMFDADNMPDSTGAFRNSWGVDERATVAAMLKFLAGRNSKKPVFLTYIPVFPHHPYDVPAPEFVRYGTDQSLSRYRNSVRYTDDAMATLLDGMNDLGLLDNTLVVVLGDHGEAFYQHPNSQGHASFLYQENVHVPLVIAHPSIEKQLRGRMLGAIPDVTPTILDLLGLPPDDRHQGISLLRPAPPRFFPMFTDLGQTRLAIRDLQWKYLRNLTQDEEELYDLSSDPQEKVDLSNQHRELVGRFRAKMDQWTAFQSDLVLNYQERVGEASKPSKKAFRLSSVPPGKVEYDRRSPRFQGGTAGKGFRVGSDRTSQGIGMYGNSSVHFALDGRYHKLIGAVGRDFRAKDGAVIGKILADGRNVFTSEILRKNTPKNEFEIELDGVEDLELRTEDAGDTVEGDHLVWLDMKLR